MSKSMKMIGLAVVAGTATSAMAQVTGPSTVQGPYMIASDADSGVLFYSIASNGNGVSAPDELYNRLNGKAPYRVIGTPDGMGVFRTAQDIAEGTFSVVCNHELNSSEGIVRDHGSRGALVSLWRIKGNPGSADFLEVVGGQDLIQNVFLWDVATESYTQWNADNPMLAYSGNVYGGANPSNNGFGRFCSADMAEPSAYFYKGLGTTARIFLNGEEIGSAGRGFAHIATGEEFGNTFELPWMGDYSWENSVANPFPQLKTVVAGFDDATPGNVYIYVGEKRSEGTVIERAGLTEGTNYAVKIDGATLVGSQFLESPEFVLGNEIDGRIESKPFELVELPDLSMMPGSQLQSLGDTLGQINFLRPEDGAWDKSDPSRLYFVTTGALGGASRLWAMDFADISQPELGGTITMLIDGGLALDSLDGGLDTVTGLTDIRSMDNIDTTAFGQVLIQEDTGSSSRLARMWSYDASFDRATEIGIPVPALFDPVNASEPNYLTQNEETSGIVDAYEAIGPGWHILCMQAHYSIAGELDEGGQLMAVFIPSTAPMTGDLNGDGVVDALDLSIVLGSFLSDGGGDLNGDGLTNAVDLSTVLANFGN